MPSCRKGPTSRKARDAGHPKFSGIHIPLILRIAVAQTWATRPTAHEFWTCWEGFDPQYCIKRNNAPDGRVLCSIVGTIYSGFASGGGSVLDLEVELAYTKVLRLATQPPQNCLTRPKTGQYVCDWPVVQICTDPPDYHPTLVNDAGASPAWYTFGVCSRYNNSVYHNQPWSCAPAGLAVKTNDTSMSPYCTSNP